MKYYQDITLLPDTETNLGFLWFKVYQQVHIALAENKLPDGSSAIAVSFPDYKQSSFPLGSRLRLLADSDETLQQMNAEQWLSRLQDYCHIKSIQPVPAVSKYACFRRKQAKSPHKKAILLAQHLGKPVEEVINFRKKNNLFKECDLPYIQMESLSSSGEEGKNRFKLFIEQTIHDKPISGSFDCYGLAKTATIPCF
jgi:CRISPR-associated endonuclease Csy4